MATTWANVENCLQIKVQSQLFAPSEGILAGRLLSELRRVTRQFESLPEIFFFSQLGTPPPTLSTYR